jgi:hypothetical protein
MSCEGDCEGRGEEEDILGRGEEIQRPWGRRSSSWDEGTVMRLLWLELSEQEESGRRWSHRRWQGVGEHVVQLF